MPQVTDAQRCVWSCCSAPLLLISQRAYDCSISIIQVILVEAVVIIWGTNFIISTFVLSSVVLYCLLLWQVIYCAALLRSVRSVSSSHICSRLALTTLITLLCRHNSSRCLREDTVVVVSVVMVVESTASFVAWKQMHRHSCCKYRLQMRDRASIRLFNLSQAMHWFNTAFLEQLLCFPPVEKDLSAEHWMIQNGFSDLKCVHPDLLGPRQRKISSQFLLKSPWVLTYCEQKSHCRLDKQLLISKLLLLSAAWVL